MTLTTLRSILAALCYLLGLIAIGQYHWLAATLLFLMSAELFWFYLPMVQNTPTPGMTHEEIKSALGEIFARIGNPEYPFVSFARVLEALGDISQHSPDAMVSGMYDDIHRTIGNAESRGTFKTVDMFDTRTEDQINTSMNLPTFNHPLR